MSYKRYPDEMSKLIQLGERSRLFCCVKTSDHPYKYSFYMKVWDADQPGHAIYFPPGRWLALTEIRHHVDEALQLIQQGKFVYNTRHIGGGVYVNSKSPFNVVDIRMKVFDYNLKEEVYSETGVTLDPKEWEDLKNCISYVEEQFPVILETTPCYQDDSHMNQMGMLTCPECCPFAAQYDTTL